MFYRLRHCPAAPLLAGLLALLVGCATPPQTRQLTQAPPADLSPQHLLAEVPFFPQKAYQCGPASLAMLLNHNGVSVSPEQLVAKVYVPAKEGALQVEMLAATREHQRLALQITPRLSSLLRWVDSGAPVLVLQNLGVNWYPKWHYAVVIGYDLEAAELILHSGEIANYRVSFDVFERTWGRSGFWGMTALVPGSLPFRDSARRYLQAASDLEETNPGADLRAAWEAGADAWPDSPDLTMALANHLYQTGERTGATDLYETLVARHPDYLPAYNNLATAQLEAGLPDRAIRTARRGLEKAQGSHPFLQETLASALRQREGQVPVPSP